MGIFFKRSENIEYKEERITNATKTMLVVYDEKTREPVYLQPGQNKIILKAIKPKLPRVVEIIRGDYER